MIPPPTPHPPENNDVIRTKNYNYKKRLLISSKTIQEIKREGYDPEEAIQYFAQIMKENKDLKIKYEQLENTIKNTLETITRITAGYHSELIKNKRLRNAIVSLHPEEYFLIIRDAEKGRYNE